MSRKQKQKEKAAQAAGIEYTIEEFLLLNINEYLLCKSCRQVHMSDDWYMNDSNCPTKGCESKSRIVIPWNLIKANPKNKKLPDSPEIGKYYNPHF